MAAVVSITVSKAKTCKGGSRGSHEPSSGATSGKSLASQLGFGFGGLGVEGFGFGGLGFNRKGCTAQNVRAKHHKTHHAIQNIAKDVVGPCNTNTFK